MVLSCRQAVPIDRYDLPSEFTRRRMWGVVAELAHRYRHQFVAHTGFKPGACNSKSGRNDFVFPGSQLLAFPHILRHSNVLRFIAEYFCGGRVAQGPGLSKNAVFALACDRAAHIGQVASREHDAPFLGSHDARCLVQLVGLDNDGFVQKWFNDLERNGRNWTTCQATAAHPR